MSKLPMLSEAQMRHLQPFVPVSRGLRRVDDRRVISGIVDVIRYSLQGKDVPPCYGLNCTLFQPDSLAQLDKAWAYAYEYDYDDEPGRSWSPR